MRDEVVTIFGAAGFIGRHLTRELARRGWRVRAAVRRPHLAQDLRVAGLPGQVHLTTANIRDEASVRAAVADADAVINLVGVLKSSGKQSFRALHAAAPGVIAAAARDAGVKNLVHVSAIGADENARAAYARSKAAGEAAVREAFPDAVILRPSIVFGPEDEFFNRFAGLATMSPMLPLFNWGRTRFQPVYVNDVAEAAANALDRAEARGRTFELGGPRAYTFKELFQLIVEVIGRPRILLPLPLLAAKTLGLAAGWTPFAPITLDQARMLAKDNVVSEGADTLVDLGVAPTAVETVLPTYLYRFRKSGQFTDLDAEAQ